MKLAPFELYRDVVGGEEAGQLVPLSFSTDQPHRTLLSTPATEPLHQGGEHSSRAVFACQQLPSQLPVIGGIEVEPLDGLRALFLVLQSTQLWKEKAATGARTGEEFLFGQEQLLRIGEEPLSSLGLHPLRVGCIVAAYQLIGDRLGADPDQEAGIAEVIKDGA